MSRKADTEQAIEAAWNMHMAEKDMAMFMMLKEIALSLAVIADSVKRTEKGIRR